MAAALIIHVRRGWYYISKYKRFLGPLWVGPFETEAECISARDADPKER